MTATCHFPPGDWAEHFAHLLADETQPAAPVVEAIAIAGLDPTLVAFRALAIIAMAKRVLREVAHAAGVEVWHGR